MPIQEGWKLLLDCFIMSLRSKRQTGKMHPELRSRGEKTRVSRRWAQISAERAA